MNREKCICQPSVLFPLPWFSLSPRQSALTWAGNAVKIAVDAQVSSEYQVIVETRLVGLIATSVDRAYVISEPGRHLDGTRRSVLRQGLNNPYENKDTSDSELLKAPFLQGS